MPQKDKIKFEELMKLKRAETPTEAQWREFDAGMKRKMALSLVKKQSFFSRAFSFSPARLVPAGATALFAATLFLSPLYFSAVSPTQSASSPSGLKSASLPELSATFAENAFYSSAAGENPIDAGMNSRLSIVSYVSASPESHLPSF